MIRHPLTLRLAIMLVVLQFGPLSPVNGQHSNATREVFIGDPCAHSVVRYQPTTGAVSTFVSAGRGGMSSPSGLTFGPRGDLFVSSRDTNSVLRYDGGSGEFTGVFIPPRSGRLDLPAGLAFGPDGSLYVASRGGHSILRYHRETGAFIDVFVPPMRGGLRNPTDLVFGPDGNLYVASYYARSVLRYSGRTGAFVDTFIPQGRGGLISPNGLAFSPDGHWFVANWGANSVFRYRATGDFVDVFASEATGLVAPVSVFVGPDDIVYISTVVGGRRVFRYVSSTGQLIDTITMPDRCELSQAAASVTFMPIAYRK